MPSETAGVLSLICADTASFPCGAFSSASCSCADSSCTSMASTDSPQFPSSSVSRPASGIINCIKQTLLSGKFSDVQFSVGRHFGPVKIFAAHKYILSIRSTVFHTMFHGSMPEKCDEYIDIPDFLPDAFANMLSYMYTDTVDHLTQDNVFPTISCADKYDLPQLTAICSEFVILHLKLTNCLNTLCQAVQCGADGVVENCLRMVDVHSEVILRSDEFTSLSPDVLHTILKRNALSAGEYDIYLAVERWAAAACARDGIDPTAANRRQVLGEALFLVRFPLLTNHELADGPGKSGLLSEAQILGIFMHQFATVKPPLPFPMERRTGFKITVTMDEPVFAQFSRQFWCPAEVSGFMAGEMVVVTWCSSGVEDTVKDEKVVRAADILTNGQWVEALIQGNHRSAVYKSAEADARHLVTYDGADWLVGFADLRMRDAQAVEWIKSSRR
ncbi:BTB/POZ domain-containing protein 6-like [Paramacrobiotus metropolitanus]|uniref:BTB/POZ domain-containing protein 6-like n=1 Tax=Paramacrobiotus metropolitanus TaxID=2943436 RepID=UPI002445CE86|nr:BTB/POZ domain-containing protein 6-like [Paramacrobiotus metropolitanus]XP_055348197.1 BTB/POZ domain-containing protein 6-like [Paramacrobiotus metropolitanus]